MAKTIVGETTQIHAKELGRGDGAIMSLHSELNDNVVTLADAHILFLKFLLVDMQHMVLGAPTGGKCEDSNKRVKNFVNETMPMTPKFEGDLPMNEVTWFELVHHTWSLFLKLKKEVTISLFRNQRSTKGSSSVLEGTRICCFKQLLWSLL
jgi:hypothetical protein